VVSCDKRTASQRSGWAGGRNAQQQRRGRRSTKKAPPLTLLRANRPQGRPRKAPDLQHAMTGRIVGIGVMASTRLRNGTASGSLCH